MTITLNSVENTTNTPELQQTWDEEREYILQLEKRYSAVFSALPIAADDSDVKRLIEAMALFVAASRVTGKQALEALYLRVFRQLLSYLACPISSMGLVQVDMRGLKEATLLAEKTVLSLKSQEGDQGIYRTCYPMPLHPLYLERIGRKTPGTGSCSIVIELTASMSAPGNITHLPIYLDIHKNISLSLSLKQWLATQLHSVSLEIDGKVFKGQFQLGYISPQLSDPVCSCAGQSYSHPIERERKFFQLPQQENYLNLYFDKTPEQWQSALITLEVNGDWPKEIPMGNDMFQLGVVAIENAMDSPAEVISYDGTQSRIPITAPTIADKLQLNHVLSVYQVGELSTKAMQAGILGEQSDAYEICEGRNGAPLLALNLPQAFDSPVNIEVNGCWYQPDFSQVLWKKLTPRTLYMAIPGASFVIFGSLVAHKSAKELSSQNLLDISALKNKSFLSLSELLFILDSMGSVFLREYMEVRALLKGLTVDQVLDSNSSGGTLQTSQSALQYHFELTEVEGNQQYLLSSFMQHLEVILNAWVSGGRVSISYGTALAMQYDEAS